MSIRYLGTSLMAVALTLAGCLPRTFSYTVVATAPEPKSDTEFRNVVREWIKQRFARSHIALIEVPSMESLNRDVRHCDSKSGCGNVGDDRVVIIDTIRYGGPDTAYATVRYFISELAKPELRFTNTQVRGVRSRDGTWTIQESIGTSGTMSQVSAP